MLAPSPLYLALGPRQCQFLSDLILYTVAVEREESAPVLTASALIVTARIVVTASTQPQVKLRVTKYLVGPPTTPPHTTTFKALPDNLGS